MCRLRILAISWIESVLADIWLASASLDVEPLAIARHCAPADLQRAVNLANPYWPCSIP